MNKPVVKIPAWMAQVFYDATPAPSGPVHTLSDDEDGSPDPLTLSPEGEAEISLMLRAVVESMLTANGLPTSADLVGELLEVINGSAWLKSAALVGTIFACLRPTPGSVALERVLLGPSESLRSAARRIGCHPADISKAERKLRRAFGLPEIGNTP